MMVLEKKGAYLGAVKGCAVPPELNEWFNNSFPILPNFQWNIGDYLSTESRERANAIMEMWYKGMINDEEFYEQFEEEVQKGTDEYIASMGIDTTGWNIPRNNLRWHAGPGLSRSRYPTVRNAGLFRMGL